MDNVKLRILMVLAVFGVVSLTPAHAGVFERIAQCESQGQQHTTGGKVMRNMRSSAVGVYQILAKTHGSRARRLGFNIFTRAGNIGYARVLFREEGTRPWSASRHCWGGRTRVASQ